MTDAELEYHFMCVRHIEDRPVTVTAGDYAYHGWLVDVFKKRRGAVRCNVEDENGRLFIHNAGQITRGWQ